MSKTVYLQAESGQVFTTSHPEYHNDCKRLTVAAGQAAIKEQDRAELRKIFPVGSLVQTMLLSVSSSGMSRRISVLVCVNGVVRNVDSLVASATGRTLSKAGGISVGGCGMDMGFSLAYGIGRALYPEGFAPSNLAIRPADGKRVNVDIGRGVKHSKTVPFSQDRAWVEKCVKEGWEFEGGRNGDTSGWDVDGGYALKHQWL